MSADYSGHLVNARAALKDSEIQAALGNYAMSIVLAVEARESIRQMVDGILELQARQNAQRAM